MMHLFKIFNYKKILVLLTLLFLYFFTCAFSYVNGVSANLSKSIFRLHVLANSNSVEDQNLKYLVRDNLISYLNTLYNGSSKEDLLRIVDSHLYDFEKLAKETIKKNGYDYDVSVKVGNFIFPSKNYGDISLPSGYYDALRIEIGNAVGNNWWCVLFPPLCFVDVSSGIVPENSKQILKNNMGEEEYHLVSESTGDIKFKFKLLELFQNSNFRDSKKIVVKHKFLCYIVLGCIDTLYF